jgi:hypothetical protein
MHRASRIVPEARQYVDAMALHATGGDVGAADLRELAVQRLARIVQHGDEREAAVAAKVLQGYLPKAAPEPAEVLANKEDSALLAELDKVLRELDDGGALKMLQLSLDVSATYSGLRFPEGGNEEEGGGRKLDSALARRPRSAEPEKRL